MRRGSQQLGALIALVVFATSAWSQNARYTVPAASVGEDFSSYDQALSNAADRALANVVEGICPRRPSGISLAWRRHLDRKYQLG